MVFIKKYILPAFCLLVILSQTNAKVFYFDGTYQGDDIYIMNPYFQKTNEFCITEAYINDTPVVDINSSAFEVPLSEFSKGQYVNIKLVHSESCAPLVLNPEAIITESTFELVSMKVEEKALKWTTNGENCEEPFFIEQFVNSRWTEIGKVKGKGPDGYNNYVFEVHHHSGLNKYRLKQRDIDSRYKYTMPVDYTSNKAAISANYKKSEQVIEFSEPAYYELLDAFGGLLSKGNAAAVDVSNVESGTYFLNIDNQTKKIVIK